MHCVSLDVARLSPFCNRVLGIVFIFPASQFPVVTNNSTVSFSFTAPDNELLQLEPEPLNRLYTSSTLHWLKGMPHLHMSPHDPTADSGITDEMPLNFAFNEDFMPQFDFANIERSFSGSFEGTGSSAVQVDVVCASNDSNQECLNTTAGSTSFESPETLSEQVDPFPKYGNPHLLLNPTPSPRSAGSMDNDFRYGNALRGMATASGSDGEASKMNSSWGVLDDEADQEAEFTQEKAASLAEFDDFLTNTWNVPEYRKHVVNQALSRTQSVRKRHADAMQTASSNPVTYTPSPTTHTAPPASCLPSSQAPVLQWTAKPQVGPYAAYSEHNHRPQAGIVYPAYGLPQQQSHSAQLGTAYTANGLPLQQQVLKSVFPLTPARNAKPVRNSHRVNPNSGMKVKVEIPTLGPVTGYDDTDPAYAHVPTTQPTNVATDLVRTNPKHAPLPHYTALKEAPRPWACFRYLPDGQVDPAQLFTPDEMSQFLFQHPLHHGCDKKTSRLQIWLQRTPAKSSHRYSTNLSHRCRFEKCLLQTINQGTSACSLLASLKASRFPVKCVC